MAADAIVVGVGLVGLATAVELADRGVEVTLIGTAHRGEASSASAGMLAPCLETELGAAHAVATASRDRYPAYLDALETRTGIAIPLNRLGVLRIVTTPEALAALHDGLPEDAIPMDAGEVANLEPAIGHVVGGVLYPRDGCLDPLSLLDALRRLASRHRGITAIPENVVRLSVSRDGEGPPCTVHTDRENRYHARTVVLAAGAWTPLIHGLPRPIPVEPVRGQMVAFDECVLRHVVYGPRGYAVPKRDGHTHEGHTLVGSTMERVGYDTETTDAGIATVRAVGEAIAPVLEHRAVHASWAGLRPVTPDLLPLLGPDPDAPGVIYACGHSRNGVLLTPVTAEIVADLVTGTAPRHDISRFRPDRF